MNQEKYIGMEVHEASICAAMKSAQGKLLMECVLETKAATILVAKSTARLAREILRISAELRECTTTIRSTGAHRNRWSQGTPYLFLAMDG